MEILSKIEKYISKEETELRCYLPGETIYKEGDRIRGVYLLKEGNVKIFKNDKNGNPIYLCSAKSGEPFGLESFFQEVDFYRSSAKSGEVETELLFFPKEVFIKLLKEQPALKLKLLRVLCKRISFMELRFKNLLYRNTDERIVETLLHLASNKAVDKKQLLIEYPIKELNEIVGVSLGYLRKRIRSMKNANLIDYGRDWLIINDIEKLKMIQKHH